MYHSICYVVCYNVDCKESGNIKKNISKCSECKKQLTNLTLEILNKYFCPNGNNCDGCGMIHPNKHHQSPPYISPCFNGKHCLNKNCLFLHPNQNNTWGVRF